MSEQAFRWLALGMYFVGLCCVALFAYVKKQNASGYFLANRSLGVFVTAMSAEATAMSGWLILALPGLTYSIGLSSVWVSVGIISGSYLNWKYVAQRLRLFTERLGAVTFAEYFEARFDDAGNMLRWLYSLVILVFYGIYCIAGLVGVAKLFQVSFDFSYAGGLLFGGALIVLYTVSGGYFAVCWSDVLQGLLVCFALCVLPVCVFLELQSMGYFAVLRVEELSARLNPFANIGWLGILSYMSWSIGYCGQPHVCLRFMSLARGCDMSRALRIAMTWRCLVFLGALSCGFLGYMYVDAVGYSLTDPEELFLFLSRVLVHPFVGGILLSAVLSSIMSTVDSQLLVSASVLSQDIYARFSKHAPSSQQVLRVARVSVCGLACVLVWIALYVDETIHQLVSYAWSGPGAILGPPMIMSLYSKKPTRNAVLAGMLSASLVLLVWNIAEIYVLLPAFLTSLCVMYVVSALDSRKVNPQILSHLGLDKASMNLLL